MQRTRRKNIFKDTILEYLNSNAKIYTIITIMFLIGIILGIIFINNSDKNQQNQINEYINNFVETIKSDIHISKTDILKNSIINNLSITLILWFLGSTIIGIPLIYIVIIYKGYSIGCTIASIIASLGAGKGSIFILSTMLLQTIIYIPCILSLAVSGIKLYKLIIDDKRRENIRVQLIKHTVFCIIIFVILIGASLVEAYISGNLSENLIKFC